MASSHAQAQEEHIRNAFSGDMAKTYNDRTGGCNIILAQHLIKLLAPYTPTPSPSASTLRIHDNACGPLVLTTELLKTPSIAAFTTPPHSLHITATDLSADFTAANRTLIASNPLYGASSKGATTVTAETMDASTLTFADNTFDLNITSLAIFALPFPLHGAQEILRTLKPRGGAALTTWKRLGWQPLLRATEALLKPDAEPTRFPMLEPWAQPGKLAGLLREAGFEDVEEGEVRAMGWWESEAEMARWVCSSLRMMVGSGWSEGEKEGMEGGMLRVIRERPELVVREGGRVGMENVAWAGVARKAGS